MYRLWKKWISQWTTTPDERAIDEASEWMAIVQRGDSSKDAAFAEWLRKDPRNVQAFLFIAGFDQELTRFCRRLQPDLGAAAGRPSSRERRSSVQWAPRAAIGAAACLLLAMGGWYFFAGDFPPEVRDYRTDIGEHRVLTLADGSTVHLNTQSRLASRFTRNARDLSLTSGEAYFVVAHDSARPFRVHTSAATVQAIGTRFNIDMHTGRVIVAVLEGKVQLALPGASGSGEPTSFAPLRAGESMEIHRVPQSAELHVTTLTPDALARRVAWTSGILSFEQEPLANVIAELNRYNRQQIVIEDPTIAGVQIGGRFKATDPGTFVKSLGTIMNVEIEKPAPTRAGTEPIRLRGRPRASL